MKTYLIQKRVKALSILEALEKEKDAPVDDVYLDQDSTEELSSCIGFRYSVTEDDDLELGEE